MVASRRDRIQSAWEGRVSGCILGKPVELLSMQHGYDELHDYLTRAEALPLRDYVPFDETGAVPLQQPCCRGYIRRGEPDDDINYTVLALLMLEEQGAGLTTEGVARNWLRRLPAGWVFTAELAAGLLPFFTLLFQYKPDLKSSGVHGYRVSLAQDAFSAVCSGTGHRTPGT